MSTLIQIGWFIILTWLLMAQLFFLAVPLAIYYLFKYPAFELMVLAIVFDGYYFKFYEVPVASLAVVVMVVLANFIKPRLLMYTKDDASLS